jgi:CRP-like cAMP-binding protein
MIVCRFEPAIEAPLREVKLEEAEFFRALSVERLQRVQAVVKDRRFWPRRLLFASGDPAEYLWVVRTGQVRLFKSSAKGQITTLEALGPGEFFGVLPTADTTPRYPASAEGLTEGRAWCVPMAVVQHLLEAEPNLGVEMVRVISERLRDAHERLHSFAYDSAAARLARTVLRLAPGGTDAADQAEVTRRALAEASGTTVETAIRTLRRFEHYGLIETEVGHVRVLDRERLRELAGLPQD